jgi:hypothetical protein
VGGAHDAPETERDCSTRDTVIADDKWKIDHWRSIVHNYSKAAYFPEYKEQFQELYSGGEDALLSRINYGFIAAICRILGIGTE